MILMCISIIVIKLITLNIFISSCDVCGHWFHQICALYNDRISVTGSSSVPPASAGGLGTGYVPKGHYECPLCKLETMEKHCKSVAEEAKLLEYRIQEDTKYNMNGLARDQGDETTADSNMEDKVGGKVKVLKSKTLHPNVSTTLRAETRSCSKAMTTVHTNANVCGVKIVKSSTTIATSKVMLPSSSITTRGSKFTAAGFSAMMTSTVTASSSSVERGAGLVAPPPTRYTSPSPSEDNLVTTAATATAAAAAKILAETGHEEDMSSVDEDDRVNKGVEEVANNIYIYTYINIYVYMYIYVYICVYTYVYLSNQRSGRGCLIIIIHITYTKNIIDDETNNYV
jgi:hypothetical protein